MMLNLLVLTLLAGLLSWLVTESTIRYAQPLGLVALPNERSSHTKITPHGGGIGIVVSTTVFTLWLLWRDDVDYVTYWAAIALAVLVAVKGLVDDIIHLSASVRLLIQFIVITGMLFGLYTLPINGLEPLNGFPLSVAFLLTLLVGMWWLNLFNFMDGIDGLAASQAIFMLAAAASLSAWFYPYLMQTTVWAWMWCLVAATLGFLLHNWSPARIFMGDTGSLFLAFMVFFLALLTISMKWLNYASWAILAAVFVSDATVTITRRLLTGFNIFHAHRSHAYQRLSRRLHSHAKTTLLVWAINLLWLLPMAYLALAYPLQSYVFLFIAYLPVLVAVWLAGAGKAGD